MSCCAIRDLGQGPLFFRVLWIGRFSSKRGFHWMFEFLVVDTHLPRQNQTRSKQQTY